MKDTPVETQRDRMTTVYAWLTQPLFTVGEASFTATSLMKLAAFFTVVFWLARVFRRVLIRRAFPRVGLETGLSHALANIISYGIIALGLLVGLQTSGIHLGTLTVLFGAMGVGIGFGLQNVAGNFVAGLILLIERPIQVGDRIQIGDLHGRVSRINIRATEVFTNDNIAVIVPNSEFISQQVINWSHGGNWIRHRVPVGIAYGSDVEEVKKALLDAAANVGAVLQDPPPMVRFVAFGDSSLDFELIAWTSELLHRRGEFISRVNFAIHEALSRHGIEIPFPQRDLHVRSSIPLPVAQVPAGRID